MKKVISGKELRNVINKAVDLICDAVSSTLGPSGNNVLINTDDLSPYITNDGVTIARSIESQDKRINTVLEILKEASLKTNEEVGDGTTTTLVLLQSFIKEGFKEIDNGVNPILLRKELNETLKIIINRLNSLKRKPSKKDLVSIASTSANDENIGKFLSDIYFKMNGNGIKLEESANNETYVEMKNGYCLEIDNISNLYFNSSNEIKLNNVYILILRGYLDSLEQISDIINEALEKNKSIVIFAEEYNESLNKELIVFFLQENKNIYLLKLPDYGSRKKQIEEDLSILSNSKIKDLNYENIYFDDLGLVNSIILKKDELTIINDNESVSKRIDYLKHELNITYETYEKEFIEDRIAKLSKGIATIFVGGNTKTEIKEKLMRFEDALCALNIASKGVIVGEGITFLKISE